MLTRPTLSMRVVPAFLTALLCVFALGGQAMAQDFQTAAKNAILIDAGTGTVLFEKEADQSYPPASLAKLMTMEVVFHAVKMGHVKLSDTFFVSENAWKNGGASSGGSTMFAQLKSEIPLSDLIQAVIVQSANDGCIIIAEGMAGSEIAFAGLMNERARDIGLKGSNFTNSTGLPDPGQYITARDLAKLAQHIIREYPEFFPIYSQESFTWNKITQSNRNPLLSMGIGADGMKTGFTEESGYSIVGTVKRNEQRLIAVLLGMTTMNERAEESRKILDWGSRAFRKVQLYAAGEVIGEASVYGGEKTGVGLAGKETVEIFLPIGFRDRLRAQITYQGPLIPPVEEGTEVATLKVWIGDKLSQETPLYASETVERGDLQRRSIDALKELALGWLPF